MFVFLRMNRCSVVAIQIGRQLKAAGLLGMFTDHEKALMAANLTIDKTSPQSRASCSAGVSQETSSSMSSVLKC